LFEESDNPLYIKIIRKGKNISLKVDPELVEIVKIESNTPPLKSIDWERERKNIL
jgi:hypothetical protein